MESFPELTDLRPRSCWLEIDLDALIHNLGQIRDRLPEQTTILAVVKAEAYGHGAEIIARTLEQQGIQHFGVATLEEALALRHFGLTGSLYIMGHLATFNVDELLDHDLIPFVYSYRLLKALNREAARRQTVARFHLKVDTGMGRLGQLPEDLPEFLEEVSSLAHVRLEGVATHFAQAGEDSNFTQKQLDAFDRVQEMVHGLELQPRFWHVMNSAAIGSPCEYPGNMARPGIMLYGYPPHPREDTGALKPVMQVRSKLADFKQLQPGHGVSYGRTFRPDRPTWIGVVPLGYADGYSRRYSNRAYMLKGGRRCPVLGNVCMDMTMIGLEAGDDPEETVTILGRDGSRSLWADQLAEWDDTIVYEVLSRFSGRLPRLYFKGGEVRGLKTEQGIQEL